MDRNDLIGLLSLSSFGLRQEDHRTVNHELIDRKTILQNIEDEGGDLSLSRDATFVFLFSVRLSETSSDGSALQRIIP